ncbi:uncharacterized protein NEMAJ01_1353 [Nematocida major]|uniref:uncharacterized protein n=1 Tax=Nematocida major TaxID=1912982 RepID=UPI002007C718|nr:uncharacterized protein NEMAJ01_1353 [Nematocida major]KAH9386457.1 hypothetical protein NEMAJ01_1353 [Nematocida major]
MKSSTSTVASLKPLRVFSKSKLLKEKGSSTPEKGAKEYLKELSRYLKELSSLDSRIRKRSSLLSTNYSEISSVSSSKDPHMLQKILRLKLTLLIERKDRLLEEISSVHSSLMAQKSQIVSSLESGRPSQSFSLYSSSENRVSLASIQNSLNQKVLEHYSKYNQALQEVEELVKDSSISKSDRKAIFSILFPTHSNDNYPLLTKAFRRVFGSRVSTGTQFIKDIIRKSSCPEIHISSSSDSFEMLSCYVHFVRNNLLISSSFVFGLVSTICIVMWKCMLPMLSSASTPALAVSACALAALLFSWASFGVFIRFFSWTFGYSHRSLASLPFSSLLGSSSSSSSESSSKGSSNNSNSNNSSSESSSMASIMPSKSEVFYSSLLPSESTSKLSNSSAPSSQSSGSSSQPSSSHSSSHSDSLLSSSHKSSSSQPSSSHSSSHSESSSSHKSSALSSQSVGSSSAQASSSNSSSSSSSSNSHGSMGSSSVSMPLSKSIFGSNSSRPLSSSMSSSVPSSMSSSMSSSVPSSMSSSAASSAHSSQKSRLSEGTSDIFEMSSEFFHFFPLFAANAMTSVGLSICMIFCFHSAISFFSKRSASSLFLLLCAGYSILSICMTVEKSMSLFKSSHKSSPMRVLSLSSLILSAVLIVSVSSFGVLEVLSLLSHTR